MGFGRGGEGGEQDRAVAGGKSKRALYFKPDVHIRLKVLAARRGKTIGEVAADLLVPALDRAEAEQAGGATE